MLVGLGVGLLILCALLYERNLKLVEERDRSSRNETAYRKDLQTYRDVNGKLNYQINLIEDKYSNLSRSTESDYERYRKIIKDQGLKIKNITGVIHIGTTIDTTFKKPIILVREIMKDTCVNFGDSLLSVNVCINSTGIEVRPLVVNVQYLLQDKKRETINPPYKWSFFRLFQRKQTVYTLKIVNSNPHIKVNEAEWKIFSR